MAIEALRGNEGPVREPVQISDSSFRTVLSASVLVALPSIFG
jgi:hypothetical protein